MSGKALGDFHDRRGLSVTDRVGEADCRRLAELSLPSRLAASARGIAARGRHAEISAKVRQSSSNMPFFMISLVKLQAQQSSRPPTQPPEWQAASRRSVYRPTDSSVAPVSSPSRAIWPQRRWSSSALATDTRRPLNLRSPDCTASHQDSDRSLSSRANNSPPGTLGLQAHSRRPTSSPRQDMFPVLLA